MGRAKGGGARTGARGTREAGDAPDAKAKDAQAKHVQAKDVQAGHDAHAGAGERDLARAPLATAPSPDVLAALAALDPALAPLVGAVSSLPPRRSRGGFPGLAWIVVSQQVSVASADAIWARVEAAHPELTPRAVREASDEALRACGLSAPKIRTLRAISEEVLERGLDLEALRHHAAEDAVARLVTVKGVGPWTAEIFLMFCLGHADVFPAGDLALQEAARLAFGLERRPDAAALRARAEAWSPHRATAARLLWAYHKIAKGRAGMSGEDGAPARPAPSPDVAKRAPAPRKRTKAQGAESGPGTTRKPSAPKGTSRAGARSPKGSEAKDGTPGGAKRAAAALPALKAGAAPRVTRPGGTRPRSGKA